MNQLYCYYVDAPNSLEEHHKDSYYKNLERTTFPGTPEGRKMAVKAAARMTKLFPHLTESFTVLEIYVER